MAGRSPFSTRKERVKREEVEKRVREEQEPCSDKFSEDARAVCRTVTGERLVAPGVPARADLRGPGVTEGHWGRSRVCPIQTLAAPQPPFPQPHSTSSLFLGAPTVGPPQPPPWLLPGEGARAGTSFCCV